ncbi:DNA integrity scanning diadenylate cyclase DisA [Aeromicrobium duanguangcaii]|uniref:DNA integrity scanning protein DisA n=1 Tax=Aeromicrobium duanguangcaii TaxID=2968086 RepID=A0ABY5KFT2_9ACTN|nr:DNA integrity scanning diadenylate cyclase DisA [Aeromicrobium duanguangcaii]MCD9154061.1 DNA integrity scanning diadenylate cyclase DisA [Aeromicrobium duanguangcaii]UUI68863.1 DNA integrity scanning diadenylate cyclase DisA [Aeromicrobium duanguangcaii]
MAVPDLRATLASVAPGTALREGLERIMRGRTGALIVIGHDRVIESISTGGFALDVPFTATGLRELAKMDGAIILDSSASRIMRAAVHLMPDPSIPTTESGTRHRTAERVARQSGIPVISVSASMTMIALYLGDQRYVLEEPTTVVSRANQALQTLERYRTRLDEVSDALSALEVEDLVTVRDVTAVAQRLEMVRRISDEIETYVLELGSDGRLLSLQLNELVGGVDAERTLVVRDYLPAGSDAQAEKVLDALADLESQEVLDLGIVAAALQIGDGNSLDASVSPHGYRLLARIPRLPPSVVERLIMHFGTLQRLLGASLDDLQAVEGVGELRARGVRDGLSRLAESSILERYV